jgi:hypothetical protein
VHQAATNRLDAVTIRIGLAGDQTERAPEALGLPSIRQLPTTGETEPALDLMEVSRRSPRKKPVSSTPHWPLRCAGAVSIQTEASPG